MLGVNTLLTVDIEEELKKPGAFDENKIESNAAPGLVDVLSKYLEEKNSTRAEVIRLLNISRNYGYQIFNGTRIPTRNCLIQISLILKLDTDQISYLLQIAGKSPLYVRNIVDARIFYAVKHQMDYHEAVDFIWSSTSV